MLGNLVVVCQHIFMQRLIHPSFGQVKPLWTGGNMDGRVVDG